MKTISESIKTLSATYVQPAADEELSGYSALDAAGIDDAVDMGLKMLMTSVPRVPGEAYPSIQRCPNLPSLARVRWKEVR